MKSLNLPFRLPARLTLLSLFPAAFAVGAGVVLWVAVGYAGQNIHNGLALGVTLLIAAFFGLGAFELWRFRQATAQLNTALQAVPDTATSLPGWLQALPDTLRHAVRQRVDGERAALPGPALTPYVTGLLVLLGMLGTFLGMVVTLNGTVIALESTTDLQSIRASLAAPVRGLGVAFGTSVAGVAASAMLGLMSALARRERVQAGQLLDSCIAGPLRGYSARHQREVERQQQLEQQRVQQDQQRLLEAQQREQQHQALLQALQAQAQQMPALLTQVQALMAQMERQHQQLGEQLLAGQDSFHRRADATTSGLGQAAQASIQGLAAATQQAVSDLTTTTQASFSGLAATTQASLGSLAASVEQSLQASLAGSAQAAGDTVRRVVEDAMGGLARESAALHLNIAATAQQQFAGLAGSFDSTLRGVAEQWQAALARSSAAFETGTATLASRVATGFEQHAAELRQTVEQQGLRTQDALAAHGEQRLAAWTQSLQGMATALQQEWQQAGVQAQAQTTHTLAEIKQLLAAAAEAPRAAAEVIAQLRQQLSESIAHDNGLLEERERIMSTLATLLDAVNHASTEQRSAIDALVASSSAMLERVGSHFTQQVQAESERLTTAAVQITGSAVEVASLGEAFGHAVQLFSASNDKLSQQLQRIEGTLAKSITRSDEQLAYYVAQAREIIDLSLLSQKQIVEDLQRFSKRQAVLAGEAA